MIQFDCIVRKATNRAGFRMRYDNRRAGCAYIPFVTIFVLIGLIGVLDFVCVYVFGIHILCRILVSFVQLVRNLEEIF